MKLQLCKLSIDECVMSNIMDLIQIRDYGNSMFLQDDIVMMIAFYPTGLKVCIIIM